ncbi:hypothetical protein Noca_0560 [Nocardioides sp. JS614]|nr:hypothetical protein Noca_0560 [Nocardioides sp. JS614]
MAHSAGDIRPAATAVPSAHRSPGLERVADSWPAADVSAAAFHMHALGMSESVSALALRTLAARGVRNVRAYVAPWTADDASRWTQRANEVQCDAERAACHLKIGHHQDPLIRGLRRRVARWPWRTSTGGDRGV